MNSCVCSVIICVIGKEFQFFIHNGTCIFKFKFLFIIVFSFTSLKILKYRNIKRQRKYAIFVVDFWVCRESCQSYVILKNRHQKEKPLKTLSLKEAISKHLKKFLGHRGSGYDLNSFYIYMEVQKNIKIEKGHYDLKILG